MNETKPNARTRPRKQIPQAVRDCHELLAWMIPQLDKFPRARKFTLGERIEGHLLSVLENLIEASYSKKKHDQLATANLKLDVARHLWRLCYRLKVISIKSYEHGSRLLMDLGRQIGGWQQASKVR